NVVVGDRACSDRGPRDGFVAGRDPVRIPARAARELLRDEPLLTGRLRGVVTVVTHARCCPRVLLPRPISTGCVDRRRIWGEFVLVGAVNEILGVRTLLIGGHVMLDGARVVLGDLDLPTLTGEAVVHHLGPLPA